MGRSIRLAVLFRRHSITLVCCIGLFFPAAILASQHPRTQTPEELLQVFYEDLLSDKPFSQCVEIFAEPSTFALELPERKVKQNSNSLTDTALIWKYLRARKTLFLFPSIDPSSTPRKAWVSYVFKAQPQASVFFHQQFSVMLSAPLSPSGKEGVVKQIVFGLERASRFDGPAYLIVLPSVAINGVSLDPASLWQRKGNLYQELGFRFSETNNESMGSRGSEPHNAHNE